MSNNWACKDCTYINPSGINCEICGAHKPSLVKQANASAKPNVPNVAVVKPAVSVTTKPTATSTIKPASTNSSAPKPTTTSVPSTNKTSSTTTSGKQPSDADIAFIVNMGFKRDLAIEALKSNREKALDWCLNYKEKPVASSKPESKIEVKANIPVASKKVIPPTASVPTLSAGTALGKTLPSQPLQSKNISSTASVSKSIETLKISSEETARLKEESEEKRKRKDTEEKEKKMAINLALVEREEAAKQNQLLLKQKKQEIESRITIQDAIGVVFQRYGIIQADTTFKIISQLLQNIINNPDNEKFKTINLKSESFLRNIGRLNGGLAIFRLTGFEETEDGNNLILKKIDVKNIEKTIHFLQTFMSSPITDLAERLILIQKQSGMDIAVYSAKEFILMIRAIGSQLNSVTKRFDYSGPFKSKIAPHKSLIDILFNVLKFIEGEDKRCAKRESLFEAEEIEYIKNLERDGNKWIAKNESSTPISLALKDHLNENPSGIVIKFVNLFIGAIQKIISQPENQLYHKIKLDVVLNKIGGQITHGDKLFNCFGFEIKNDGAAILKLPLDLPILSAKFQDLTACWDQCGQQGFLN